MSFEKPSLIAEHFLNTEADTDSLGRGLAAWLPAGAKVALCGTLGAGKTRLTQAIAESVGVDRSLVTSPTFALMQTYPVNSHSHVKRIHHLDAYRIVDEDEFLELGIEEIWEDSDAWTLIEWADRFANLMPPDTLWIDIELTDQARVARLYSHVV